MPSSNLGSPFNGNCLAQQATDSKSNEITAIPELLKLLDLRVALVTIDALDCQKEIAIEIVASAGLGRLHVQLGDDSQILAGRASFPTQSNENESDQQI